MILSYDAILGRMEFSERTGADDYRHRSRAHPTTAHASKISQLRTTERLVANLSETTRSALQDQNDQLMAERRTFGLKSALRLEWCGQDGHYET